jgi:spore germination cell wall hydrolase CwlJ-like protein
MTEPVPSSEFRPRDFSARLTRRGRARPFAKARGHRHVGRRAAVLAVAIAVPAMANSGDWRQANTAPPPIAATPHPNDLPNLRETAGLPPADVLGIALPQPSAGGTAPGLAARPLAGAGSFTDRLRAQRCLTLAIYYEAAKEPDAGQRAVAQVVLNRVAHPAYPDTVCGVVFQGSERSTGCQFSFTCDGSLARAPARAWWDRAARVASEALAGEVYAPVGLATHYHTLQVHPYWADSLQSIGTIGAHRFYRWRGAAGQQAAFSDRYFGGEPVAAPHPRLARPAPDTADQLTLARAYEASLEGARRAAASPLPSAELSPKLADTPTVAAAGPFQGSGQVREEYAHSGQWLRPPGASPIMVNR